MRSRETTFPTFVAISRISYSTRASIIPFKLSALPYVVPRTFLLLLQEIMKADRTAGQQNKYCDSRSFPYSNVVRPRGLGHRSLSSQQSFVSRQMDVEASQKKTLPRPKETQGEGIRCRLLCIEESVSLGEEANLPRGLPVPFTGRTMYICPPAWPS